MILTPNMLSMLLSVHIRGDRNHGLVSVEAQAFSDASDKLQAAGLIQRQISPAGERWEPTPKGAAHIKGVMAVETPVESWKTIYPQN